MMDERAGICSTQHKEKRISQRLTVLGGIKAHFVIFQQFVNKEVYAHRLRIGLPTLIVQFLDYLLLWLFMEDGHDGAGKISRYVMHIIYSLMS